MNNNNRTAASLRFGLTTLLLLVIHGTTLGYTIVMKSGKTIQGELKFQDESFIRIQDADGVVLKIKKSLIDLPATEKANAATITKSPESTGIINKEAPETTPNVSDKKEQKLKKKQVFTNADVVPQGNVGTEDSLLEVPPDQMRKVLADSYRLKPDRRFLLSIAEIHHLLSGETIENPHVVFDSGKWIIRYKNLEVGALPEFPDFSDASALLSDWTKRLISRSGFRLISSSSSNNPEIEAGTEQFYFSSLLPALNQADALWMKGVRTSGVLISATKALVRLNLQILDDVELGDGLTAMALASLTLAKGTTQETMIHDECLLATTMGYSTYAAKACKQLPRQDAARMYGMKEDEGLRKAATMPDALPETRYLWLLRLASLKDKNAWFEYQQKFFPKMFQPLPVMKAGLALGDFDTERSWSKLLPTLIILQITKEQSLSEPLTENPELKDLLTAKVSILVDRFEKTLRFMSKDKKGPFLDSDRFIDFYRSYFYSSLYIRGLFYMDSLSSVEAVRDFSEELGNTATAGPAHDFQRWYENLANSKKGNTDIQPLFDEFDNLPNLGARVLFRTLDRVEPRTPQGDSRLFLAIKKLAARMDSRLRHRFYFCEVARNDLKDLKLVEKLCGSVIRDDVLDEVEGTAWCAHFTGNQKLLFQLLDSPRFELSEKSDILRYLAHRDDVDKNRLDSEFRRMTSGYPDDWDVRDQYVDFLRAASRNKETIPVILGWLKTHTASEGFDYIFACKQLAYTYYLEKQYQDGWKAIEPVVDTWQAGAMQKAVWLLDKLGRTQEALKLARDAVARYPDDSDTRSDLVEVLWGQQNYVEAADTLISSKHQISHSDWCYVVGKRFAAFFGDKPKQPAFEALKALVSKKADPITYKCACQELAKAGHYELAYELSVEANEKGQADIEMFVDNFHCLNQWKGKAKAIEWARKQGLHEKFSDLSLVMFDHKEHDLLWELVENPETTSNPALVWLMRAASSIRLGPGKDPYRQKLSQHYEQQNGDFYHTIGRFLVGLETERQLLMLAQDPQRRALASYFIGLKAQSEGNYDDASDWYRVCIETGQNVIGYYPMQWAFKTLNEWAHEKKSIAQIAAKKL